MKHYLYKITNIETGEYYLGVRSHKNPEKDSYMGSSSVWNKEFIKSNKHLLSKEILDSSFETRESANLAEVDLLKSHESDNLCINCLFDKIPSHLGRKQSEEWVAKRIKSGENASFYGHHHTDESKKKISESLKGRPTSDLQKETASKTHKGKTVSEETRKKQSDIAKEQLASGKRKKRYTPIVVKDLELNITEFFEGVKVFSDTYDLSYGACQSALQKGHLYKKRYKLMYAASFSDESRTLGENGENPVVDNPVGSLGNAEVLETAND